MKAHQKALAHFAKVDKTLYQTALRYEVDNIFVIESHTNYFERLCRSITGQQLSTKAADTIWKRFSLLANNQIEPKIILALGHDQLRGAGLSNAKAKYVHGLAEAVEAETIDLEKLAQQTNQEVIQELTKLKGIGVWTAEMFLMFTLGREDLFSLGDLGLRRAIEKLYQIKDPTTDYLTELSSKWSPYRTYACRILWENLDNNPLP